MRKCFYLAALALFVLATGQARAVDLLTNGAFEPVGGEVPDWLLEEYVSTSLTPINSAELVTSNATQTGIPGERHLFVRAFVGGKDPGPNNLTNAVLSQVVPISSGVEYNFSGWSRFEANFSGGVDTLSAEGPLGAVTSPTVTELMVEFLDNSSNLVGSPLTINVKADRIAQIGFPDPNDNSYYQHLLTGSAPAGATQARLTAGAYDMVWNGTGTGPAQSMFYDSFSFTTTSDPSTQLLTNPGLETVPDTGLGDWTLVTNDPANPANVEIIRSATFANRPASGGARGVWFSSFFGEISPPAETGAPVDGTLFQTISGTPGEQYTFSGWTRWEANFSGGQDTLSGGTQVWMGLPSPTQMFMELAFLDSMGEVIGSPTQLDLKAERVAACGGNANSGTCGPDANGWVEHSLTAMAPTGTVDVRVSGIMIAGVSTGGGQSAFFDDFMLTAGSSSIPGDFDGDGDVDGRDFLVWQRGGSPAPLSASDLADWQANYGNGALVANVSAVPEPLSGSLMVIALATGCLIRGRRLS
jgi:hypothetical protein